MENKNEYIAIDPSEYYVFHPRPAYLIVTKIDENRYNVMAVSWAMPISSEPPLLAIAIGKESYTHEILSRNGELTVNIVGEEHANLVYKAGTLSGKKLDKWKVLGLVPVPSEKVSVPGIKGAYGIVECKVRSKIDAGECSLFICDILAIKVLANTYTKYGWNLRKAKILLHQSGRAFVLPGKIIFAER